jgi:serine protease Do
MSLEPSRRIPLVLALASMPLAGCSSDAEAGPPPSVPTWSQGDVVKDPGYDPRVSLAPMLEQVMPAVVSIEAEGGSGKWGPTPAGGGSGFIIESDGVVVTNNHVVNGHEKFKVHLNDGRVFAATVVGQDSQTDVAVLKLDGARALPTVSLGKNERVSVGDWVIAIGSPLGLDQTVTRGIVSAKGRGSLGLYDDGYADFIQTDANLSPGNSGGPLFNLRGEVVGMNTAIAGMGRGIGFAIPIDQIKRVLPALEKGKTVERGWLGVTSKPPETVLGKRPTPGAVVDEVHPDTPAAKAGLQAGDRIVEVDGEKVDDFDALRSLIGAHPPGKRVRLKVRRNGKSKTIKVALGGRPGSEDLARLGAGGSKPRAARPPSPGPQAPGGTWSWQDFWSWPQSQPAPPAPTPKHAPTRDLYDGGPARLGIAIADGDGKLTIDSVEPASVAARLGLRPGDIIETINGERMTSVDDVRAALTRDRTKISVRARRGSTVHTGAISTR